MTIILKFSKIKNNGFLFYERNKKFVKFFYNVKKKNNNYFKNELKGYKWYFGQLKKNKLTPAINIKKNKFEISVLKGKSFKHWENLINNKILINKVIEHYLDFWPQKKISPFHGDLTIENIIFQKNNDPIIVDWEDFDSRQIWGLDICYFLISLIVLPALTKKKNISNSSLKSFSLIWKKFFEGKNFSYLRDPVEYIKKIKKRRNFFYKISDKMKYRIYNEIL